MKKCKIQILFLVGLTLYPLSGQLSEIYGRSVTVQNEKGTFRLELNSEVKELGILKKLKKGDPLTLWYSMDVKKLERPASVESPKQQPGVGAPHDVPWLLDDRAFYPA
jgi:hypothetical protein